MILKSIAKRRILCGFIFVALAIIVASLLLESDFSDLLILKAKYNNVRPLDPQKRCMVVEVKPESIQGEVNGLSPILKFYDIQKNEFLHLDSARIITHVKEIRSGYYALYDHTGTQCYAVIMPYASDDDYANADDEVRIIDCSYKWYRDLEFVCSLPILPDNVVDAERQLIELYEYTDHCGEALINYVYYHPETLEYDFDRIKKETEVSILTSPDGKLRFYTWNTGKGGTSPDYAAFVQYSYYNGIFLDEFTPMSNSIYVCKTHVKEDGYIPYEEGEVECLHQICQPNENPIYIVSNYSKSSSREGQQDAFALQVKHGKLQKFPIVGKDGEQMYSVVCYYYIPDWSFTTDGLGWDWIMSLDTETKTLYVPEDTGSRLTDRYDKYRFIDGKIRYVGNDAGFWLHPSLHDFKRLCGIYQTKAKLIRIDLLNNGEYRFAAWNKNDAMINEPEMILVGASENEIGNALIFENGNYQYIVPAFRRGEGYDFDKFIIKKNGLVIQTEKV